MHNSDFDPDSDDSERRYYSEDDTDGGADENTETESDPPYYVEPAFQIDQEGRVICESHTEIRRIKELQILGNDTELEYMLSCKNCGHYLNDDCYFPKKEIDRIEADRVSGVFRCKLCGMRIDRPLTVIHSLYYKAKYNIEIPLICCSCYGSLNRGNYLKESRGRLIFMLISLAVNLYFLVTYFMSIIALRQYGLLLFGIPFGFWVFVLVENVKVIYELIRGRRFYKFLFGNEELPPSEPEEQKNGRDDFFFL